MQTESVLVIDAANVIGSRPTGWWRDRAGAARTFVSQVRGAVESGSLTGSVVVVVEGQARDGVPAGLVGGVRVVHAPGSGDDTLVEAVTEAAERPVTLVTADRELRARAEAVGARIVGPRWLLDRLD